MHETPTLTLWLATQPYSYSSDHPACIQITMQDYKVTLVLSVAYLVITQTISGVRTAPESSFAMRTSLREWKDYTIGCISCRALTIQHPEPNFPIHKSSLFPTNLVLPKGFNDACLDALERETCRTDKEIDSQSIDKPDHGIIVENIDVPFIM